MNFLITRQIKPREGTSFARLRKLS